MRDLLQDLRIESPLDRYLRDLAGLEVHLKGCKGIEVTVT
jgi:hypothetical protein